MTEFNSTGYKKKNVTEVSAFAEFTVPAEKG